MEKITKYFIDNNNQYISVEISDEKLNIFSIRYNIYTYNGAKSLQDNFRRISGKKLNWVESDETFGEVIEEWQFENFVNFEVLIIIVKTCAAISGMIINLEKE